VSTRLLEKDKASHTCFVHLSKIITPETLPLIRQIGGRISRELECPKGHRQRIDLLPVDNTNLKTRYDVAFPKFKIRPDTYCSKCDCYTTKTPTDSDDIITIPSYKKQ
jgi:hypothetical protein